MKTDKHCLSIWCAQDLTHHELRQCPCCHSHTSFSHSSVPFESLVPVASSYIGSPSKHLESLLSKKHILHLRTSQCRKSRMSLCANDQEQGDSWSLLGFLLGHDQFGSMEDFSFISFSPWSSFFPTLPPQFFHLCVQSIFAFSSSSRDKNKPTESSCLQLVGSPRDSDLLPDECVLSFLTPHTHPHSLLPLRHHLPFSPTLHALCASCGLRVNRFLCFCDVGFLTEAISSHITGEIKPTLKTRLLVFYFTLLAVKFQDLFSQKGLTNAHNRAMQEKGKPCNPTLPQSKLQGNLI